MAGTAKTFYTLAVGLHAMLEQEEPAYRRILISRPNAQFDDDIGFLPGDESEKIAPLLRPVVDNLELLVDQNEKERFADERSLSGKVEELFDRGIVDAQALNFIRGRSISKTYLVIDEAQNLTPKQAKGIITRAGMGTKIILLGDPQQIDHPLLDERTNGLSYAAEKMKGSPLCWQVTMSAEECERSALAMDAVKGCKWIGFYICTGKVVSDMKGNRSFQEAIARIRQKLRSSRKRCIGVLLILLGIVLGIVSRAAGGSPSQDFTSGILMGLSAGILLVGILAVLLSFIRRR